MHVNGVCKHTQARTHTHTHTHTYIQSITKKDITCPRGVTGGHFQPWTFNILARFSDACGMLLLLLLLLVCVCVCECVRVRWEGGREGCWEEGRDVTSPLWCSHTSSSSPPPPPPTSGPLPSSSSPSSLPFYAAALECVCVCVSQWWHSLGHVTVEVVVVVLGGRKKRRRNGGGQEGGSEWPGAEHSRTRELFDGVQHGGRNRKRKRFKRFNAAPTSVITFTLNVITDPPVQPPYRPDRRESVIFGPKMSTWNRRNAFGYQNCSKKKKKKSQILLWIYTQIQFEPLSCCRGFVKS